MRKNIVRTAALVCAMLAAAGCVEPMWESGREIRFGARSVAEPMTKTSYGEIVQVDENTKKQMVDWAAGDVVRIVCEQATNPTPGRNHYADYVTTAGVRQGTTAESRATLSLHSSNADGLKWGSTTAAHVFYAVYPSPNYFNDESHSLTSDGRLKGVIPAEQPAVSVSGPTDGAYVAEPDMKNQYMAAKKTVAAGKQSFADGEVFLYFTPITTAIEFEVTNSMGDDLAIEKIEIESASRNLSGVFTSNLAGGESLTGLEENGGTVPSVQSLSSNTNKAAVSFGEDGVTLEEGQKLTFTIFLLPEYSLNDLTFRIIRKNGAGYIQTALKRDASTWITFERGLKHFVKGLLVQEGVRWTMDFTSEVVSWKTGKIANAEIFDQNNYVFEVNGSTDWTSMVYNNTTAAQSQTLTVTSYTSPKEDDAARSAVPFDAMYSIDGGATWNSFNASSAGSAINGLYGFAGTNNTGSVEGLDYTLTAAARPASQPGSHEYWVGDNGDWSPADWSSEPDPIPLNQYNFRTDEILQRGFASTANCYIIRHAGTYCLPLIYGNGQLNGSNNRKAYMFGSQSSGALSECLNYKGNPISTAIIAEDLGIVTYQNAYTQVPNTLTKFSAEVLWQDESGVIKNLSIIKITYFAWNGYGHTVHGLQFTVDPSKICQCNAVIVLKDDRGDIVWSWHIWVTNDPAVTNTADEIVKSNGRVYDFFPMPAIGLKTGSVFFGRAKLILKLRQQKSGKELLLTVNQKDVNGSFSALYYQHGRKDPFAESAVFGTSPMSGNPVTNAINNPATPFTGWNDGGYSNLWSGAFSVCGSAVEAQDAMRKTIYDPSPAGYAVPVQPAHFQFTSDSRIGVFYNGSYFKLTDGDKEGTFFGAYGYKASGSDVTGKCTMGRYWSSIPETSSYGGVFELTSDSVGFPTDIPLSSACTVRPVADPNFKTR